MGHHADDFIETLLLNLFFAGTLNALANVVPSHLLDRRLNPPWEMREVAAPALDETARASPLTLHR